MARKVHQTPKKGNLTPRPTASSEMTSNSSVTSLEDHEFTVISYARKARGSTDSTMQGSDNTSQKTMPTRKLKMAANWNFAEFQREIYFIIQDIINTYHVSIHVYSEHSSSILKET
jgi:hypothetical protein